MPQVTFDNPEVSKQDMTVDQQGRVYVTTDLVGASVNIAVEVVEEPPEDAGVDANGDGDD